MQICAVQGRMVRHDVTGKVVEGTITVPRTQYWLRLLRDGDVALAETEAPTTSTSTALIASGFGSEAVEEA